MLRAAVPSYPGIRPILIAVRFGLFSEQAVEFAFESLAANDSWFQDQEWSLPSPCNRPADLSAALSRLRSLHTDADGIADVVAIGACAIPALKAILFEREPSGLYQVRCRAAEALGLWGAFDVLEEFLREWKSAADPVERLGDDVVISRVARAISQRQDVSTFALLCELTSRRPLAGLISALASFRRAEVMPILIGALGEDETRLAAETGLVSFGATARTCLLDAADHLKVCNDLSESLLRKCRSILKLLGEIKLDGDEEGRLRPFMTSADAQVSVLACRIALRSGSRRTRMDARARLTHLRTRAPWFERLQIDQYLASTSN